MPKNVDIHIRAQGADQAKRDIDKVAESSKNVGQEVSAAGQQAGDSMEKAGQKINTAGGAISGILSSLKGGVIAFIGAWVGFSTVIRWLDKFKQKLEEAAAAQRQIYQDSLGLMEIGQALEFQTQTTGQQKFWTQKALELQKAGGLASPQIAGQMMVSGDIVFSKQGGIKNEKIRDILNQLSPFIGAAQLSEAEVAKLFDFAGTAGVAPTVEGYKEFFSKLWSGYTQGKPVRFGDFMEGLQKGGTAYISQGGSLEEAISSFNAARSVSAGEDLAATLLTQIVNLSSGGYEKPRMAIEKGLGVRWSNLSTDERKAALLQYVGRLPASKRTQILVKEGFSPDFAGQLSKMISPEAVSTMEATRQKVDTAKPGDIDKIGESYTESMLGQKRQSKAENQAEELKEENLLQWQQLMENMNEKFERIKGTYGDDPTISDSIEPYIMAYKELLEKVDKLREKLPYVSLDLEQLRTDIIGVMRSRKIYKPTNWVTGRGRANQLGYEFTEIYNRELETSKKSEPAAPVTNNNTTNINYNYDHSIRYYPTTGSRSDLGVGPRMPPP